MLKKIELRAARCLVFALACIASSQSAFALTDPDTVTLTSNPANTDCNDGHSISFDLVDSNSNIVASPFQVPAGFTLFMTDVVWSGLPSSPPVTIDPTQGAGFHIEARQGDARAQPRVVLNAQQLTSAYAAGEHAYTKPLAFPTGLHLCASAFNNNAGFLRPTVTIQGYLSPAGGVVVSPPSG